MTEYTSTERFWLGAMAVAGALGLNGVFFYGLLQPDLLREALSNPIALAFALEALVLSAALSLLLRRWGVTRLRWGWFVALALVGSLAFALGAAALLWPLRQDEGQRARPH